MNLSCILLSGMLAFVAEPPDKAPGPPDDAPPKDRPNPREIWRAADADKNGSLNFEEFSTLPRIEKLPEEARRKLFDRLDKNGSGAIDAPELQPPNQDGRDGRDGRDGHRKFPRLAELDANKDGKIDFEEFSKGRGFMQMPDDRKRKLFDRMDQNKDGFLTPEDHPKDEHRPNFQRFDKNGDGAVDLEEFKAAPFAKDQTPEEVEKRFQRLDRDGNKKLEGEELAPQPRRGGDQPRGKDGRDGRDGRPDFKRLDANNDGTVDFEEFKAAPFAKGLSEDALEDRFEQMDKNGNKKLEGEELTPPRPEGPGDRPRGPEGRPDGPRDDRRPPAPPMEEMEE